MPFLYTLPRMPLKAVLTNLVLKRKKRLNKSIEWIFDWIKLFWMTNPAVRYVWNRLVGGFLVAHKMWIYFILTMVKLMSLHLNQLKPLIITWLFVNIVIKIGLQNTKTCFRTMQDNVTDLQRPLVLCVFVSVIWDIFGIFLYSPVYGHCWEFIFKYLAQWILSK